MDMVEGLPHRLAMTDGRMRRIGVEIEFGGVDVPGAAALVQRLFGGRIEDAGTHQLKVCDTALGDFHVELDTHLAHAARAGADDNLMLAMRREAAEAMGDVMQAWMPCEISSPPVPLTDLPRIDELAAALREAGAEGSRVRPHYIYALQLNPEARSLDWPDVLRVLQAFLLMEDWLRHRSLRDLLRRLTWYVRHYPDSYRCLVLQPGYRPGWDGMIRDYLQFNRTRNRDLDMLPLFAHCRPRLVAALFHDERVKARPTYHYRIPDSRIDEPGWSVGEEWKQWVRVECLAADEERFERARRAYLDWGARADRDVWRAWLGENVLQTGEERDGQPPPAQASRSSA